MLLSTAGMLFILESFFLITVQCCVLALLETGYIFLITVQCCVLVLLENRLYFRNYCTLLFSGPTGKPVIFS